MTIKTVNPYSGETLATYQEESEDVLEKKISKLRQSQEEWSRNIDNRIDYLKNELKPGLEKNKHDFARLMSSEMGKPIKQSVAEVEKCIRLVDYGIENFKKFLSPENIITEAKKSYVRFDPSGVVLIIMPWNFPMWQVMRAAIPALAAGNAVILKHASIVTGTSLKMDEVFDSPVFTTAVTGGAKALEMIKNVDGVSFTGSTGVGSMIAQEAGKHIKKVVLELGGSDPFIVLKSADIDEAVEQATFGRLQNNGQSCIASKRFLVHEGIFEEFRSKLKERFGSVEIGDPLMEKTFLGPLSSMDQTKIVLSQVDQLKTIGSVDMIGKPSGGIVPPTIAVTEKKYNEEVFGPVAVLRKFRSNEEAIKIANETDFGLGASIWGDPDEAEKLVPGVKAGLVFVNKVVASDPRLPFGGVKRSGVGRELSRYGLLEFANIKTVWVQ